MSSALGPAIIIHNEKITLTSIANDTFGQSPFGSMDACMPSSCPGLCGFPACNPKSMATPRVSVAISKPIPQILSSNRMG